MYQGHLPGSPIQRHSAGPIFPFIVGAYGLGGWFLLLPNGTSADHDTYEAAYADGERRLAARTAATATRTTLRTAYVSAAKYR